MNNLSTKIKEKNTPFREAVNAKFGINAFSEEVMDFFEKYVALVQSTERAQALAKVINIVNDEEFQGEAGKNWLEQYTYAQEIIKKIEKLFVNGNVEDKSNE